MVAIKGLLWLFLIAPLNPKCQIQIRRDISKLSKLDLTWPRLTWPGLSWPDLTYPCLTVTQKSHPTRPVHHPERLLHSINCSPPPPKHYAVPLQDATFGLLFAQQGYIALANGPQGFLSRVYALPLLVALCILLVALCFLLFALCYCKRTRV